MLSFFVFLHLPHTFYLHPFFSGILVSQITDEMARELLTDTAAVLDSQRNLGEVSELTISTILHISRSSVFVNLCLCIAFYAVWCSRSSVKVDQQ